ncbi:unnamed protein product [Musa banksii]
MPRAQRILVVLPSPSHAHACCRPTITRHVTRVYSCVRASPPDTLAQAAQRCYDWLKRLCPVTGSDKASGDESVPRLIGRVNSSTASSSRFTLATGSAHLSAAQMFDRPSFPHPQFL